jgi:hypothetical protein
VKEEVIRRWGILLQSALVHINTLLEQVCRDGDGSLAGAGVSHGGSGVPCDSHQHCWAYSSRAHSWPITADWLCQIAHSTHNNLLTLGDLAWRFPANQIVLYSCPTAPALRRLARSG